jgi:hypothetical protein
MSKRRKFEGFEGAFFSDQECSAIYSVRPMQRRKNSVWRGIRGQAPFRKCEVFEIFHVDKMFVKSTGSFSGFCLSLGYRIPCGLFTPGSFYPVVFANGLVLKNLAKWRDFHYSQIFSQIVTFRGFHI